MEEKKCKTCNQIKKIDEFQTLKCYKTKKKYKRNSCKECRAKHCSEYQKKYYNINAQKILKQQKKYYQKNSKKIKQRMKEYRKDYYQKNKEKLQEKNRNYYLNNKEKISDRKHNWLKRKLKQDTVFYLKYRISHRIRENLKSKKMLKNNKTVEILGCNPLFLKKHLESQFILNMSWKNRSQWHIDHIIPIKAAKTEFEVIALNHYTNLQPLWAKDNLTKKDLFNKEDFDNYMSWYIKNVRTEEEYNSLTL